MRHLSVIGLAVISVQLACGNGPIEPGPANATAPCAIALPACLASIEIGESLTLRHYRTHDLATPHPEITTALIMVHGNSRNADSYFTTAVIATRAADRLDSTVVVAPNFLTTDDLPAPSEAFWTSNGWKRGHLSIADPLKPGRVSSYAAADRIIEALANRTNFPSLQTLIIAGHSAGGQFVHRYAAGNRMEQTLQSVSVRYVVANPSSYLYLGSERAVAGSVDTFDLPSISSCPDYNEWHYGLNGLNNYMSDLPTGQIETQLVGRDVTHLLGSADSLSGSLDVTCGAMLQGPFRYLRGVTLFNYMKTFYPSHHHTLTVVDGVGHSSVEMFTSDNGVQALFR